MIHATELGIESNQFVSCIRWSLSELCVITNINLESWCIVWNVCDLSWLQDAKLWYRCEISWAVPHCGSKLGNWNGPAVKLDHSYSMKKKTLFKNDQPKGVGHVCATDLEVQGVSLWTWNRLVFLYIRSTSLSPQWNTYLCSGKYATFTWEIKS